MHREVDRVWDETQVVRLFLQVQGHRSIRPWGQGVLWLEGDATGLATPFRSLDHRSSRIVEVFCHRDSCGGAKVQVPEHVACGQRRHQQVLGVISGWVSTENGIRRAENRGLSGSGYFMISLVVSIP